MQGPEWSLAGTGSSSGLLLQKLQDTWKWHSPGAAADFPFQSFAKGFWNVSAAAVNHVPNSSAVGILLISLGAIRAGINLPWQSFVHAFYEGGFWLPYSYWENSKHIASLVIGICLKREKIPWLSCFFQLMRLSSSFIEISLPCRQCIFCWGLHKRGYNQRVWPKRHILKETRASRTVCIVVIGTIHIFLHSDIYNSMSCEMLSSPRIRRFGLH